ncbi:hypothetical protein BJV77DRAFT_1072302 [Russula vinacea]|nr:hypothetical protein BJV77DRAFT_1072302 [Russula vinacea]
MAIAMPTTAMATSTSTATIMATDHPRPAEGSQLPDPRTPMSMPAGSTHARVHAHWIYACTHSQAHARTLAPGPHATHTGSHAHSLAGSPTLLGLHARTHWVRVPMPARSWGPSRMHTPGPHARSLAGLHSNIMGLYSTEYGLAIGDAHVSIVQGFQVNVKDHQ